jgi:hypothetical protein
MMDDDPAIDDLEPLADDESPPATRIVPMPSHRRGMRWSGQRVRRLGRYIGHPRRRQGDAP